MACPRLLTAILGFFITGIFSACGDLRADSCDAVWTDPSVSACACGWQISGWLASGVTFNPMASGDDFNGYVIQNDQANEAQLNQLYVIAGYNTQLGSGISCGLQADLMYGSDAFFFQSLGLDDRWGSSVDPTRPQLVLPQAIWTCELPVGDGLTIQAGKWLALVGYETGFATIDAFYSKTLGYSITPATHAGILGTIDWGSLVSVSVGLHRGSDVWVDNNNDLAFTASCTYADVDGGVSFGGAITVGPEQDEQSDFQDLDGAPGADSPGQNLVRSVAYGFVELPLSDRWRYVAAIDWFDQAGSSQSGIDGAEGYGLTQYFLVDVSEDCSLGARLEIYRDDDGFVSTGLRSGNEGVAGVYSSLTLGANYRVSPSWTFRPEMRWDWQDRDHEDDPLAFGGGTRMSQFLWAADVVWAF